ncbi:hypothetical protein BY458DRAFT_493150 [Sporodiniella umbellata]|nr:hypothetical protein BY458DRAFT_493150 [Sporodiniella umbellata]
MNSVREQFEHSNVYNPQHKGWTQQKEVERLLKLQQLALWQREQASLYTMNYPAQNYCLQDFSPEDPFLMDYPNYLLPQEGTFYSDVMPNKAEKAQKRAEHNAIERARRESLNTKLQQLALSLPNIQNDRRPSKGTIIERTLEYIKQTVEKEEDFKCQIEQLRKANQDLYSQMIIQEDEDDAFIEHETPEQTYTCRSSAASSPSLIDAALAYPFEKIEHIDLFTLQNRTGLYSTI